MGSRRCEPTLTKSVVTHKMKKTFNLPPSNSTLCAPCQRPFPRNPARTPKPWEPQVPSPEEAPTLVPPHLFLAPPPRRASSGGALQQKMSRLNGLLSRLHNRHGDCRAAVTDAIIIVAYLRHGALRPSCMGPSHPSVPTLSRRK